MSLRLNRRAMLRGAGGVAIGLPALEAMFDRHGTAYAQGGGGPPKRYALVFAGTALGGDGDPVHNDYFPNTVGRNYDVKSAIAPIADIKDDVSVVSELQIPVGNVAGGRYGGYHVSTMSPLFSGMRSTAAPATCNGPTSDQIVAAAIAGNTPIKNLVYRAQVAWYLSVADASNRDLISFRANPSGGRPIPVPAVVDPKMAFNSMFSNFNPPAPGTTTAPTAPAAPAPPDLRTRARKSIIDLVRLRTERLLPRLSKLDRERMTLHLQEIRDLEKRITAIPSVGGGGGGATLSCAKLPDPGAFTVGGNQAGSTLSGSSFNINSGYSDEDKRAQVFCDLIHMAFACDISRVAAFMLTYFQSHMSAYAIVGARCDVHELGHNGDPKIRGTVNGVSKVVAWHVKHYAYLVRKLRNTPEGAGRLLDNSAILFLNEAGHGLSPAENKPNAAHSSENMAVMIAGRAGGLKAGKHVRATDKHPANVIVSAMEAVGAGSKLGEVTGTIPELFTA